MKRGKKLIGLVVAVILGLSLILIPVASRVSPAQAAVTWTKYGEVALDNELYVVDAWVIKESSTSYKMWYTHAQKDLSISEIIDTITTTLDLDALVNDVANLDLEQFLGHLTNLDASDIADLLDGISTVIGYATSSNGITWDVQNSQALTGSSCAIWNSVGAPCVMWDETDSQYKMWYTRAKTDLNQTDLGNILTKIANTNTATRKNGILDLMDSISTVIGYAESSDGEVWPVEDQIAQVLPVSSIDVWSSVADPCVIWDETDNKYKMWYTRPKTNLTRDDLDDILADIADIDGFGIDGLLDILDVTSTVIGYATWDGVPANNWIVQDSQVLPETSGGAWDSVADPSVIRNSATDYEMWYTNVKTNFLEADLHTLANEIKELDIAALWTTLNDEGIFQFITELVAGIDDIKALLDSTSTVIGYATWDGVSANWAVQNSQHLTGSGPPWDSVAAPSVVKTGDRYEMWYTEGIAELTHLNLLSLVSGDNLPIGYAYYTPPEEDDEVVVPPVEPPVIPPVEPPVISPVEPPVIPPVEPPVIPPVEPPVIPPVEPPVTPELIEELPPEEAAEVIEEMATEEAAGIIEAVSTDTAVDIIEEVSTDTAVDIIEEVSTDTAVDIIEGVSTDTAVDIMEEVVTDKAADIIEEVTLDTAVNILEEVATDKAADIMEEVATDTLNDLVGEMSEESLMDTLPEVSTDTLHTVDVETLFDALPNAPTEQLTSEKPPEPPADLTDPIVRYVTPEGAQYVAIRTEAGQWVVVMATPEPLDKLMIKTSKALKDVETTVEILDELPPEVAVGLPVGQIVMKYIDISFENAKPKDIELGHVGFHVENEWLEQNSIHKWSVALNQYDPELGQWLSLPTKRIGEDDVYVYYTAVVTHFSTFAISGSQVVPPLKFEASNLVIGSTGTEAGEDITISADITNLSTTAGTYAVTLWIDDTVEAGKNVSLEAGEKTPVSFTVTRDAEGSYQVRLDRLFGSFRVIGVIEAPLAWWVWLIVGLGVVVICGLLAYSLWWRRRIA